MCKTHCAYALRRLREWPVEKLLDAVRATCWCDANGSETVADGSYADLQRIFGPSHGRRQQLDRWVRKWEQAGRPEAGSLRGQALAIRTETPSYSDIARSIDDLCGTNR